MLYKSAEDRLNPIAPAHVDEGTLGGYSATYGRAAAFEGCDGQPYTVAIETEQSENESWAAYLVFLRWAASGSAVMGHLETGDLVSADTEHEARTRLAEMPLARVKQLLDETIKHRADL